MTNLSPIKNKKKYFQSADDPNYLLIAGVLLVAFNLRPGITSVGPIIPIIRESTGMANSTAGLLTTIPLLSFAVFSLVAPKLGVRYGNHVSIFVGLIILGVGILLRSTGIITAIFTGTALIGVGISICNVLLPGVIKLSFPQKVGLMTSLYITSLNLFASFGSGLSVILSETLGLGWELSLSFWAIVTFWAILIWIPRLKEDKKIAKTSIIQRRIKFSESVWSSPLAWFVTLFMGIQSFFYFSLITWIPDVLSELGLTLSLGGGLVFLLQLVGIPFSFVAPILAEKLYNQKPIVLGIGFFYILGFLGILFFPNIVIIVISIISVGIAQGGALSLALAFISFRSSNNRDALVLSGMAQSIGYFLASIGPIFIGYLYDAFHTWTPFLVLLCVMSILIVMFGLKAGENKHIFQYSDVQQSN
ncbi:CynX/NimT family MFS transporter [Natribacillus halophilus]|uniref:MFS transporter, CP family, cyanate transporter n=1 Tax=Natribacillus halophilus TaxID=549003 RepID=A0A1G8R9X0_9BACI|nr:MFS transporter [Natribacillus halophilus]SDJ13663.1 MFS transporter, CP family, cyanate transporter [Natribacillus halophilus]